MLLRLIVAHSHVVQHQKKLRLRGDASAEAAVALGEGTAAGLGVEEMELAKDRGAGNSSAAWPLHCRKSRNSNIRFIDQTRFEWEFQGPRERSFGRIFVATLIDSGVRALEPQFIRKEHYRTVPGLIQLQQSCPRNHGKEVHALPGCQICRDLLMGSA